MKTYSSVLSFVLLLTTVFTASAQDKNKKETIKVWGECGMCKKTIEKAALGAGATSANWNEDKKKLTIAYNTGKTSNRKIQEAVAAAGYDTQDVTADNAAYSNLHECCQYQRKEAAAPANAPDSTHHH